MRTLSLASTVPDEGPGASPDEGSRPFPEEVPPAFPEELLFAVFLVEAGVLACFPISKLCRVTLLSDRRTLGRRWS